MGASNTSKVTLDALTPEQVEALFAQMRARDEQQKAAAKAKREKGKTLTSAFVATVVHELERQTFTSGAEGYSLGGKVEIDGTTYRVSVLIRDEATIPPKDAA